jgi:hypothetical protein
MVKVKLGGAYSAQEVKKKGKKPYADVKERKPSERGSGERSRAGHRIPRAEMIAYRERATQRGYKMGTCFICGKDHKAHLCPDYSEKASAPRIEDAHAATSMGKVEELDEYEDDDDEVAYAAVRKIVSKANKRAFKDGKLMTGDLHAGVVGLDTCASNHLFGSLACIDLVRGCTPLDFLGIGGRERITQIGDHDVWGTVYIRPSDSSVNLLSLSMLESTPGIRISYSQE